MTHRQNVFAWHRSSDAPVVLALPGDDDPRPWPAPTPVDPDDETFDGGFEPYDRDAVVELPPLTVVRSTPDRSHSMGPTIARRFFGGRSK